MKEDERFHWVGRLHNVILYALAAYAIWHSISRHDILIEMLTNIRTNASSRGHFYGYLIGFYLFWPVVVFTPYAILLVISYVTGQKFYKPYEKHWPLDSWLFLIDMVEQMFWYFLAMLFVAGLYFAINQEFQWAVIMKHIILTMCPLYWIGISLKRPTIS